MEAVNVSTNYKSVLPFGKPHTQLITQPVSFLRGYLAWLKRLPDLVGDNVIFFLLPSAFGLVNPLSQSKLRIGNLAVALIAADEIAVIRLFRVLHIINNSCYGFACFAAFARMQRNKSCCCRLFITPPP